MASPHSPKVVGDSVEVIDSLRGFWTEYQFREIQSIHREVHQHIQLVPSVSVWVGMCGSVCVWVWLSIEVTKG